MFREFKTVQESYHKNSTETDIKWFFLAKDKKGETCVTTVFLTKVEFKIID